MKFFGLATLLFGVCLATSVHAEDADTVKGTFFLSEQGCDAKSVASGCVMSFQISGDAARGLYDRLKGKAVKEPCTGGMMKTDGKGLRCIKAEGNHYDCDFGYSFKSKAMVPSEVTC